MPIFLLDSGAGSGTRRDASAVCAAQVREAEGIQLDMLILMDGSGSMKDEVTGGPKWDLLVAALRAFMTDPASAGIGVGLTYFGIPAGSDGGETFVSCNVADYVDPAVPIGPLPKNASPIAGSLAAYVPQGGTPTRPALAGATEYANTWLARHSTHRVIVVLATDGEPNDCDSTVDAVAQLAASAAATTPSIQTYVIGVGDSLSNLDQVAAAGGTGHAYVVDTGGSTTQSFVEAMNSIRGAAALPCQYALPASGTSGALDYENVNVAYSAGVDAAPGKKEILFQVADPSACAAAGGGWYYDDPTAPKSIQLCPSTCTQVEHDLAGRVEVLVGCKTQKHVPR